PRKSQAAKTHCVRSRRASDWPAKLSPEKVRSPAARRAVIAWRSGIKNPLRRCAVEAYPESAGGWVVGRKYLSSPIVREAATDRAVIAPFFPTRLPAYWQAAGHSGDSDAQADQGPSSRYRHGAGRGRQQ